MRVVVDTNVFVSSFFGGNPRKIIDLWKEGQLTLCLSRSILEEYVKVLQRMGLEQEDLEEILAVFARGWNSLFTAQTPNLKIVESDPGDDKFIECAVALNARVIITGDKALVDIGHYVGIKLVTPKKFLDGYSEQ